MGGLPDRRISRLPDSLPNYVAKHLGEALSRRELQRVGRVSLSVSLPTHRNRGMSVMWSWRTPAGRCIAPKIADSSWIPPVAHLLTAHVPAARTHQRSHSNIHGSSPSSTGQQHRSVTSMARVSSPHVYTHTPRLGHPSFTQLAAAPPARKSLPRSSQKVSIPPGRKIPSGFELLKPQTGQCAT